MDNKKARTRNPRKDKSDRRGCLRGWGQGLGQETNLLRPGHSQVFPRREKSGRALKEMSIRMRHRKLDSNGGGLKESFWESAKSIKERRKRPSQSNEGARCLRSLRIDASKANRGPSIPTEEWVSAEKGGMARETFDRDN